MKRKYLRTERAHFMCPNMHFGMLLEVEKEYHSERLSATLERMAEAHPFLKSLIAREDGTEQLYYGETEYSQIEWMVRNDVATLWEDYKEIAQKDWNVFENGMLKVFVYPQEKTMTVLLVAHHLLTDGKGLMGLATEFANDYVGGIFPAYAEEHLLERIEDLPNKSRLSGVSKMLIRQANRQWEKENQRVSYEKYCAFVEEYANTHPITYQTYEIVGDKLEKITKQCKEHRVTMNDWLMANMYEKTNTTKIIIAEDIRKEFANYQQGALGNYATAMGIVYKGRGNTLMDNAKKIHALVSKRIKNNRARMLVLACYFEMNETLLDAAAISGMGGFQSKAGQFVGGGMFGFAEPKSYSITNLGKLENKYVKSLLFIPPASPASKLTLGVVTLNGTLRACSSEINT